MNAAPYPSTGSSRKALAARKKFAPEFRRAPRRPGVFEPVFREFLEFLTRAQGLFPCTVGLVRLHVSTFLEFVHRCGCRRWRDLHISHVDRFTRDYVLRFNRRYRASVLYAIRKFLQYLYSQGLTDRPLDAAMLRVRLFANERLPRFLKPAEVRRLLLSIDRRTPLGRRDYVATVLLLSTGLRAGEFMRLTLDDVDWRARHLTVRRSKTGPGREVPIPQSAFRVLVDYVRRSRPRESPSRHLFFSYSYTGKPSRWMTPLTIRTLGHHMRKYLKRAGLTLRASLHGLRHTYAQTMVEEGMGYADLQSLLGHATLRATGIYARVNMKALREVAENHAEDL